MTIKKLNESLVSIRPALIEKSLRDAIVWCGSPSDNSRLPHRSDQYWMLMFSTPDVTAEKMKNFFSSFQLVRAGWDYGRAADLVNVFIGKSDIDPLVDIGSFALELRLATKKHSQQTSAASKIAMLAKPAAKVFIWDQLANRSTRLAEWVRSGGASDVKLDRLFCREARDKNDPVSPHDYAAYARSCAAVLDEARATEDFQAAVHRFSEALSAVDGPMGDRSATNIDFLERRLLDKLMFWEGWYLRYWDENFHKVGELVEADVGLLAKNAAMRGHDVPSGEVASR